MPKFIDFITNLLGILLIPYGAYLIYALEKFTAWDFLLICFASFLLIWFKNDAARSIVEKIISSKLGNNIQSEPAINSSDRRVRRKDNIDNFIVDKPD